VAYYNKTISRMKRIVIPVLVTAAIAALSFFALFNWMQKPTLEPASATATPIASQAPNVQTDATPVQAPFPAIESTDVETLVAPIALYPDLLLAQLLPASTYPLEIVQAAHWLESKPDLARASGHGWAPGITALLQFPQLIFMMNDQFDWTAELGDRFLAKPDSVLSAIQSIRARAMTAGLLKDSPEQKVTKAAVTKVSIGNQPDARASADAPSAAKATQTRQIEVIRIEPANPQIIYIPQYNPQALYSAPTKPAPYSYKSKAPVYDTTTPQTSPWLTYSEGVATGALLGWAISEWNDDIWDDNHGVYSQQPHISRYSGNYNGYNGGSSNVNIYRDATVFSNERNAISKKTLNRPVPTPWIHDPLHRRGYRYTAETQQSLNTSKQQPALAGQRHTSVNSDYAGYDRDKQDLMRQAQMEKTLEQSDTSSHQQQNKTVQQKTQESAFSELPQNNKAATENQRTKILESGQQTNLPSTITPEATPHSTPASDRTVGTTNFTGHSSEASNIFSDVREGNEAQKFSKRGRTSRTESRIDATRDGRRQKE
jgi:hypothetical protein